MANKHILRKQRNAPNLLGGKTKVEEASASEKH